MIRLSKPCPKCGQTKSKVSNKSKILGYTYICKPCDYKDKRDYHAVNKQKLKLKKTAYREANPMVWRDNHNRKLYGITLLERGAIFERQLGICANANCSNGATDIDHDHKTGKVRGMLCNDCNTSLGSLCDDIARIHSLADYLVPNGPGGA